MSFYKDAGVDQTLADNILANLAQQSGTQNDQVYSSIGGFASLYKLDENKLLAACTDGVGTKLLLARELQQFDSIGIDLVAMCINDLLCVRATPLFFLDYLALNKLETKQFNQLLAGVFAGCKAANVPLIGGETAEMPGLYAKGDFDMAGFAIGQVDRRDLFDFNQIQAGDKLVAMPSTGLHSNGFSLFRQLFPYHDAHHDLWKMALEPTQIYSQQLKPYFYSADLLGLCHITGGGLANLTRLSKQLNYEFDNLKVCMQDLPIYQHLLDTGLPIKELYTVFNMGVGMICMVKQDSPTLQQLMQAGYHCIGEISEGTGKIILHEYDVVI